MTGRNPHNCIAKVLKIDQSKLIWVKIPQKWLKMAKLWSFSRTKMSLEMRIFCKILNAITMQKQNFKTLQMFNSKHLHKALLTHTASWLISSPYKSLTTYPPLEGSTQIPVKYPPLYKKKNLNHARGLGEENFDPIHRVSRC